MTIDNYFLPSNDLAQSQDFYQNVLGLPVKFDFSDAGMVAHRVGDDEPALILKAVSQFPDARPAVWFAIDDVRAEHARLTALGVKFLSAPFPIRTGWAVELDDPSGNRLGLTDYQKG